MRRAIVHVGMPKTGSTSLQAFFKVNTQAFAEAGITYPDRLIYPDGHAELGVIALTRAGHLVPDPVDRDKIGIASLEDQVRLTETLSQETEALWPAEGSVLFSSESLSYWLRRPEMRASLDAWLSERFDEVAYVMFVRSEESFVLSNYAEAVKRGLDESLDRVVAVGNIQSVVRTLRQWHRQFGPRLEPRMLPGREAPPTQIYADFCEILGISGDFAEAGGEGLAVPQARNLSPSALQLAVMRWFNRRMGPNYARTPRQQRLSRRVISVSRRLPGGRRRLDLTESQRALIRLRNPRDVSEMVTTFRRRNGAQPAPPAVTPPTVPPEVRLEARP